MMTTQMEKFTTTRFRTKQECPYAFLFAEVPSDYYTITGANISGTEHLQCAVKPNPCSRDDAVLTGMAQQVRDLTAQNVRLQEKNRVCAAYIADIAHELRNSLLTLNFYVELLAKRHSARHDHYQQMAVQSVDRLRNFVEDTLNLSRLEFAGTQRGEMVAVDLNALIREVVTHQQVRAERTGLELRFVPATGLPPVLGDEQLLLQVITNLVTNALKYTQQGWVEVRTIFVAATQEVVLEVADSGIGIAAQDVPFLFERFYRARDKQIDAISGTGLGLAIVKEIVNLHQGDLVVESTPGVGSCFRVCLPRRVAQVR
ncbi:MAG: HAMP domain-containing histidine kinase [Caldilineaceae bacterium]|nr:HAMP domain-containing histidine kinase [Caldilineaceae bacterium]